MVFTAMFVGGEGGGLPCASMGIDRNQGAVGRLGSPLC